VLSGDGGEAPLRPGVAATVEIELPAREGVLLVPNAALGFTPQGGARARSMFWRQGRSASGRRVDRRQRRRRTEILANGLEPGVQVITGRRHSPVVQGAGGTRAETGTAPRALHGDETDEKDRQPPCRRPNFRAVQPPV
jgi:hypothetical protein